MDLPKPYFKDADVYPEEALIQEALGSSYGSWTAFQSFLRNEFAEYEGEWRFYKDGNAWLHKVVRKKKTLCWVTVSADVFMVTCYFPDRAEDPICNSAMNPELIEQFVHGKHYGKTRGLTILTREPADLENIKIMLNIRHAIK